MKLVQFLALATALCFPLAIQAGPPSGSTTENPDKTGMHAGLVSGFSGPTNQFSGGIIYEVPTGKRLVIESATSFCFVAASEKVHRNYIYLKSGGVSLNHNLIPVFTGSDATFGYYTMNWSGKLYADAGPIQMGATKNGPLAASYTCYYTLSGYLVTVP